MTNNPNVPPNQQPQNGPGHNGPAGYWQQFPQHANPGTSQQGFGGPPPPYGPAQGKPSPKGRFGPSFWIVGALLALMVLGNATGGHGESILIFLGIAALLTGLYSLIFKRPSWAALPGRNAAVVVLVAGAAALLVGGVAAGVERSQRNVAAPTTSAQLEADAAAKLATREEAVKKAEEAVKAREAAAGTAPAEAARSTIKEGVWTVGKDVIPGNYRTIKEVVGNCSWKITRTGSNGSDYIAYDLFVKGGFPMVTLLEGQTFDTDGCGDWAKQ
ncbi:hypothetical protein [Paenarthrobacter sp. C1]|uniref:hypothetical protein n=1 Tax=Paenarthrobacter sp. C1 TaxID=3400220 RepID=UPI003BF47F3E